jgi:serine/threonine protein kinase
MGEVFLAIDEDGRTVAVKALHPVIATAPETRMRLRREVETMRRVRSARVAEVVDFDLGGSPYIVTRYVQGRSLADVVAARGPLRGADLLRVARGLAEALSAIHAAQCVHRDLKPANVMLVDGEPVIIDFGIAHAIDATRVTQQGAMGSPGYMAPEVLQGGRVEPAADVFAWAGTLVFAATGRHAYAGSTPQVVHHRTLAGTPDLEGVVPPLRPLVEAALALDPIRRPSALELAHRLSGPVNHGRPTEGTPWGDHQTVAEAADAPAPPGDPGRRPAGAAAGPVARPGRDEGAGTAAVIALVGMFGMLLWASGLVWLYWSAGVAVLAGLMIYGDDGKGPGRLRSALSSLAYAGLLTGAVTYVLALIIWVVG